MSSDRTWQGWSDEEREALRVRYSLDPIEAIARDLGRSKGAISTQAKLMGLRRGLRKMRVQR